MADKKDTHRYSVWDGRKLVYYGITDDLARREAQHRAKRWNFRRMRKEGPAVTEHTARDWEQTRLENYRRGHRGRNPRYNKQ